MREDYFGGGIVPKVATTSRHRWSLHSGAFDGARSCDGEIQSFRLGVGNLSLRQNNSRPSALAEHSTQSLTLAKRFPSATLQGLNFQRRGVLKRLQKDMPDSNITDVRFRLQSS